MDQSTRDTVATRIELAERRLATAVRIDFHAFLGAAVEERLRARPNFMSRTPLDAQVMIRSEVSDQADQAAGKAETRLRELRARLVASPPSDDAAELAALARALRDIEQTTEQMLIEWSFPGDDKPDRADVTQVDLDATWQLGYQASPQVVWCWRQCRELDRAAHALTADPSADSFEIRFHVPELGRGKHKR